MSAAEDKMADPTPRNQEGQAPTRTPQETDRRLTEKAQGQRGGENRRLTEAKAKRAR